MHHQCVLIVGLLLRRIPLNRVHIVVKGVVIYVPGLLFNLVCCGGGRHVDLCCVVVLKVFGSWFRIHFGREFLIHWFHDKVLFFMKFVLNDFEARQRCFFRFFCAFVSCTFAPEDTADL